MLDQNTDRMWFVIGAVIVGAAIIFIANGTLPDLFASVAETFEQTSEEALSVADAIGQPRKNYILDSRAPRSSDNDYYPYFVDYVVDEDLVHDLVGEQVTLSFDARALVDDEHILDTYFSVSEGQVAYRTTVKSRKIPITGDWGRYSVVLKVDELRGLEGMQYSLRFRGNPSIHAANENHFMTRNVKVELGLGETEYFPNEKDGE